MCYTGECIYEDHMGDCNRKSHNVLKGLPIDFYPEDAGCSIRDREIDKLEEKMNCNCVTEIQEALREKYPEARINTGFRFPDMNEVITVEYTYQPVNKKKKKTGNLIVNFCPFCGKSIKKE